MPSRRFQREGRGLPPELEEMRLHIVELGKSYGLDFFETNFLMCNWEEINMLAAYEGFPVRYPHWRWGMEYLRMQKSYEFGLHKIYEMVINTNPSYAYLLDNNLIVDQKLVMAHVLGHVDFFKNNVWFAPTNRRMLDTMANHATRIRRIMDRHGQSEVEAFIDLCLSLDNLIDPYAEHIRRHRQFSEEQIEAAESDVEVARIPAKDYMDPHINPPKFLEAQRQKKLDDLMKMKSVPEEPQRDVLKFLLDHAPLARWQYDCLQIVRDEAYYFAPQAKTKIMNEGWATFWHTRLMTDHILDESEVIDYCDHHSGTVAQQPGQLNPYKMGVELFRDIQMRWSTGRHGKEWLDCDDATIKREWDTGAGAEIGLEKVFEVRRTHNDVTFLDTFLTEDFCRRQGFFTTKYDPRSRQWIINTREFRAVKKQMLQTLAQRGTPRAYVVDANHGNRQELRLNHRHDGLDIKLEWASTVLGNLAALWSRPVHLETMVDGKPVMLTHDGSEMKQRELDTQADEAEAVA